MTACGGGLCVCALLVPVLAEAMQCTLGLPHGWFALTEILYVLGLAP